MCRDCLLALRESVGTIPNEVEIHYTHTHRTFEKTPDVSRQLAADALGFALRPHFFEEPYVAARMLPASLQDTPPPTQKVPFNEGQLTSYNQATALQALADPCNSCKFMYHQLFLGIRGSSLLPAAPVVPAGSPPAQVKGKGVALDERGVHEWTPNFSVDRVKRTVVLAD